MSSQPQRSHESHISHESHDEVSPVKTGLPASASALASSTPSETPGLTTTPPVASPTGSQEGRPVEREKIGAQRRARGTAAMDPATRKEVARKGGIAVSKNRQHMADIGRKGGQSISQNREHMAKIGRKGGAASRGHKA